MMRWNKFDTTVKMNELFSPVLLALQDFCFVTTFFCFQVNRSATNHCKTLICSLIELKIETKTQKKLFYLTVR